MSKASLPAYPVQWIADIENSLNGFVHFQCSYLVLVHFQCSYSVHYPMPYYVWDVFQ